MSWQRPPFDPRRAKTWAGGFSRVFGVVSDGTTTTYRLRATAAAYLVVFDGVFVDGDDWSINANDLSVHFRYVPPAGSWIEILGFGVQTEHVIDPKKWLVDDIEVLMDKLPALTPAVSPRYAIEQLNLDWVHSTNGVVIGSDGHLYLVPQDEYDIIRVEPENGVTERIRVPELDLYEYGKFAGGFSGPNGKVYAIPDKAGYVMEYDPATRKGKMLQIEPTLGDSVWTNDMINTGATVGNLTYGIPFDADFFMMIDDYGEKVYYDTLGLDLSAPGKWYGGVHYNGDFYAVPYNHTSILHIRSDGTVGLIPLTTAHPEYAAKYRGAAVVGNKAYFAPFEADHVLVFNLDDHTMTEERYGFDTELEDRFKFWGCAAAAGKVVFVPFETREIFEVDTAAGTAKFTTYNLYEDILDVFRSYAGAYTDNNSRIHFLSYNGACGLVVDVVRQQAYVRKMTGRTGMYNSSGVAFQDGCYDGEGRITINPYNTDAVHWTIDTRKYATEYTDGDWWWRTDQGYLYHRPTTGENAITAVRDYGDHYWLLRDDGDINQKRLSGYEWGFWTDGGPNQDPIWTDYLPPEVRDPQHFPTWKWKRNKAFFGSVSADNGRLYSCPSSQPYYLDRVDMPEKIFGTYVPRVGLSRDQWYNGVVQASDGKMYAIPYNGTHVLIFDPVTETTEYKDYGIDMMGRRKWYGGIRDGDFIYCIPFDYPGFLVINTVTGSAGIQTFGYDLSGKRKFMSAVKRGNELIFVPCDHPYFFAYNTTDLTRDMTDYGIPRSIMDEKLKWGAALVDKNNYVVCGPLGYPAGLHYMATSGPGLRSAAWISPTGASGWTSNKFQGCGAGWISIFGEFMFRTKETFAKQDLIDGSPRIVPDLRNKVGATNIDFRRFRNIAAYGWYTDCCYVVDQFIHCLTEGQDLKGSVNPEDWSIYNEFYDDVPGYRPWLGIPPAAWTQFDPDEAELYPLMELYAYRKTALWNDPIFVGNNTAYALHSSGGVIVRDTRTQYNHFREYIWDTNNYVRCWYGAVDTEDEVYAVPHALPLLNVLDKNTGKSEFRRFVHPEGWDHTVLFKDGTLYGDDVVFFPYKQKWFCYYNRTTKTSTFHEIPDALYTADGWRAWVRRGDEVYGMPYNSDRILVWDLATKSCAAVPAPPEEENWRGQLWSDAITFYKSESHPERDTAFMLPYNDDRLGVMYPWARASGPYMELEHFTTRFPGAEKWSCWATPVSTTPLPFIYGVPYNSDKVLVCDIRGDEPELTDFGLSLDWSQPGKWNSTASFLCGMLGQRPVSMFIPYNSTELVIIDHWTDKAYKPQYNGPSLAGVSKWWGAGAMNYTYAGDAQQEIPARQYAFVYAVPFDAPGVLAMEVNVKIVNNEPQFTVDATMMDFGMDMSGAGKWRGCVNMGPYILMIPYNHNRFLVIEPPASSTSSPLDIADTTAFQHIIGIPVEYLAPQAKWAPQHTTARNDEDLLETNIEFEFLSETHPYTLRVSYNTNALQGYMIAHEQIPMTDRGWRPVRHTQPYAPKYQYSFGMPFDCETFMTVKGSKCDYHNAGHRLHRNRKFAAACLDRDDKIFCLSAGGLQSWVFDPADGTAAWVRQSNAVPQAPGGMEEFAYRAPGGKIYGAVQAAYRTGEAPETHQPVRYAWELGDVFMWDYCAEFQDTHSYWPRWFSFQAKRAHARWKDRWYLVPSNGLPSAPAQLVTERRVHGGAFSSELGFGLLPGNTGNLILYKRTAGREGFARKQMSFVHACGTSAPQQVRSPNTYFPLSGGLEVIWFMPTVTNSKFEIANGSADPFYVHRVDVTTGNITHHKLDIPWYMNTPTVPLSYFVIMGRAYMMPKQEPILADETREPLPVLRFDPTTGTTDRLEAPGSWHAWLPDVHEMPDGTYRLISDDGNFLLRINSDGTLGGVIEGSDDFKIWNLGFGTKQHNMPQFAVHDGLMYCPHYTITRTYRPTYTRTEMHLWVKNLMDGTATLYETSNSEEGDIPGYMVGGAGFYKDGIVYHSLHTVLGKSNKDADINNRFYYVKIDVETKKFSVEYVDGGKTRQQQRTFSASDGTVWFEAVPNTELVKFLRVDFENNWVDEPSITQRHVGCPGGEATEGTSNPEAGWRLNTQFNPVRVWEGDRLYLITDLIMARPSVLYILDTTDGKMQSYGYMLACKDTHKWNGAVYDDHRYAYGMPFNNDTILRMDFDDYDNVKIDQVKVDDYSYVETYDGGRRLSHIFHQSSSAENYCRGGTVNKYRTIFANSYAPLNGQTLEIKANGKTRVRAYGWDYLYPRKWADAVMGSDGRVYAAPFDSPEVMVIDADYDRAGSSFANMYEGLDGKGKYTVAAAGDGFVAMLPFNAEDVLIVDHTNQELRKIEPAGLDLTGEGKWWGSARRNNWIYCAPYDSQYVLKFSVTSLNGELLPVPAGLDVAPEDDKAKWRCLVMGADNKAYSAPFDTGDMLCVDTTTDEVTRFVPLMDLSEPRLFSCAALSQFGDSLVAAGGEAGDYFFLNFEEYMANPDDEDPTLKLVGDRIEPNFVMPKYRNRHSHITSRVYYDDENEIDVEQYYYGPSDCREPVNSIGNEFELGGQPGDYPNNLGADKWMGGYMGRQEGEIVGTFLVPHSYDYVGFINLDGQLSLQNIGLLLEGKKKWSVPIFYDGDLVYVPYNENRWLHVNADNLQGDLTTLGKTIPDGEERWASVFQFDNMVYGVPYSARLSFKLDMTDIENSLEYYGMSVAGQILDGERKWKNTCRYKDQAYAAPYDADVILGCEADGTAFARTPTVRFDGDNLFSGVAWDGQRVVMSNDKSDHLYVISDGKAAPTYNVPGTSTALRTGGVVALSGGGFVVLPGGDRRFVVITEELDEDDEPTGNLVYDMQDIPNDGNQSIRYVSAAERDGKLYFIPFGSGRVTIYDLESKVATAATNPSYTKGSWSGYFTLGNGNIVGVPYYAESFLTITTGDVVTALKHGLTTELEGEKKWWGSATVGNRHFLIPHDAQTVCVITEDPDDNSLSFAFEDYGLDLTAEAKWKGAVVRDKYIICMPDQGGEFLVIDTETDTAELIEDLGGYASYGRSAGFVDDGESVWLAPSSNTQVVKVTIDTTGTVKLASKLVELKLHMKGEAKYAGCFAVESRNQVIFVPRKATNFIEYYPEENYAYIKSYGLAMTDVEKYSGVAMGSDGVAYFAAWESTRAKLDTGLMYVANLSPTGLYDTGIVAAGATVYIKAEGNTLYSFQGGGYGTGRVLGGIAGFVSDRDSFMGMAVGGLNLYMAPFDAEFLFALGLVSGTDAYRQLAADLPVFEKKWAEGVVTSDGSAMYALPFNDKRVFWNNGQTNTLVTVDNVPEGENLWMGGVEYKGKIYGAPFDAKVVAIYDIETKKMTVSAFNRSEDPTMEWKSKWHGGFVYDDKIYFYPYLHTNFFVIDPATGSSSMKSVDLPTSRDGEPMWLAWVERKGKYYGMPYQSEDVAEYDPASGVLKNIQLELQIDIGKHKWASGCATSNGDIVFMPYDADRAMYLTTRTQRARFTWCGQREVLDKLRPIAGVAAWKDNAELHQEEIFDDPEEVEEAVDESWKYAVVSAVSGAVQYDRETGTVGTGISNFASNEKWPSEQYLSFVYSPDIGVTYGIPYNGENIFRLTGVRDGLSGDGVSIGLSRMTPDMDVNYERHTSEVKGQGTMMWDILADNFIGSTRNVKMDAVIVGGSSRNVIRMEAFAGILVETDLDGFLEWNRPTEILQIPDSAPITVDHTLWDHKYSIYSAVVMGPDGILYTIANSAHWGLAWSGDDQRNKVYMPYGGLEHAGDMVEGDVSGLLKKGAEFEAYSAGAVAASGHIIMAPGLPVTAGMMRKMGQGWATHTWFQLGERHFDSRGHVSDRKMLPILRLDTGVKADCDAMYIISPLINGH